MMCNLQLTQGHAADIMSGSRVVPGLKMRCLSFHLMFATALTLAGPALAGSMAVPPLSEAEAAVALDPVTPDAAPVKVHVFAAEPAPVKVHVFAAEPSPVKVHVFAAEPAPVKVHVFAATPPSVAVPPLSTGEAAAAFAVVDDTFVRAALSARLDDPGFAADDDGRAIRAFYAGRGDSPAWTEAGAWTRTARLAIERLRRAGEDGLDATRYAVVDPALPTPSVEAAVRADLSLSAALVAYSRHASSGRLDTTRIERGISALITVDQHAPDPLAVLRDLHASGDVVAALEAFNPTHPGFLRLRAKLAEIRAKAAAEKAVADRLPPVPEGPALRGGATGPRVAVLRERLGLPKVEPAVYDETVVAAVRAFQKTARLRVTGIVGPQTLRALNGAAGPDYAPIEAEIVANMERWRWLPRDLGAAHVFVNVPQFEMWVKQDGRVIHESRVIVGKPETPTPIFSDTMSFVVVNPSWYVPQSIIKREFLPRLASDPTYLERRGFDVSYRNGRIVGVRQPPGGGNALGHIKFMFPNKHAVYLHDTSSRSLFSSKRRAYSHGCVRVDAPFDFAEIVMRPEFGWTAERVKGLVGRGERRINLDRPIAIHIAYFTVDVDASGELRFFDDIYGHDRRVLQALATPRA